VFIVPKSVRMKHARDTLIEQPFIRLARQSWTGRFIDQTLRQRGIDVQTVMELDTPDGIAEMVARGFGISIIPLYDGRWLDDSRLNVWRFSQPKLERGVSVLERQAHTRTALTGALVQRLLDTQRNNRRSVRLKTTSLD
jgi:DNA-binding transcriptional LysR family regulator